MKYIRTKDGKIYAFYDIEILVDVVIGYVNERDKNALDGGSYFGKEGIGIADTIEELCDEFVCDHNNGTRVIQIKECKPHFPFCEDTIDYFRRNNQTFYGAIWTDKGLIYVAKMNDKGELELL